MPQTGILQWKFATGDVVHTSPAVVGNIVYIGSWDSRLYALDAESGQQRWAFQAGQDPTYHNQVGFQSSPAVVDGTVYVGCRDAHVYALDAATGRKKWDYPTSKSWVIGTPAVRDGTVYVGTSDSVALHGTRCEDRAAASSTITARAYIFSSAALAGDLVYFGNHNGRLYAVDTKSGLLAWQFQTRGVEGRPDEDAEPGRQSSIARRSRRCSATSRTCTSTSIATSRSARSCRRRPCDQGVVYVGSIDGNLYALI